MVPPPIGSKIAILCPATPPHPAGWYSAHVLSHLPPNGMRVEWDGGDEEEVWGREWRVLGEEPDIKGNTSVKVKLFTQPVIIQCLAPALIILIFFLIFISTFVCLFIPALRRLARGSSKTKNKK